MISKDFVPINSRLKKCDRCNKECSTYEEHHVWCKFMDNPHGYTWKEYPNRLALCLTCHKALYQTIIIPLLNEKARTLKKVGREDLIWKLIAQIDRENTITEVCEATIKFLENFKYGNT